MAINHQTASTQHPVINSVYSLPTSTIHPRRLCASQKLGIEFIPSIILDLDDDEAIIRMVDSNIQREYLLPSERATHNKVRMRGLTGLCISYFSLSRTQNSTISRSSSQGMVWL